MNVTCPNCATIYRVDPRKVPAGGIRARCAVCSAIFAVGHSGPQAEPAAVAVAAPVATPAVAEPRAPVAPPVTTPVPEAPRPAPMVAAPTPAPAAAAAPVAAPVPPVAAPAMPRPVSGPPAPASQPARPAAPYRPMAQPPAVARPAGMPSRPAAAPPPQEPAPRRPVNPFLSQDPSQKARRLARALISDMVVYHPAKRREGLRDGNLKTLFDEEIKKSWEEYVDQVGKDIAEGTAHFKDALNEILADGRQIF